MRNHLHRVVRLQAVGVIALMTFLGFAVLTVTRSAAAPVGTASAASLAPGATALDIAPTGTASASTAASGAPASNAIDGSASTNWCASEWTGTLTVDSVAARPRWLWPDARAARRRPRRCRSAYASVAGDWERPKAAQQMSVPAGEPVYVPLSGGGAAAPATCKVSVTDNDGTPPCIGELRLFERQPLERDPGAWRRPVVRAAGGGSGGRLHRQRGRRFSAANPELATASTTSACASGSTRRPVTANLARDLQMASGSRPPATSCTSTSITRTSGRTRSIKTSLPPGRGKT